MTVESILRSVDYQLCQIPNSNCLSEISCFINLSIILSLFKLMFPVLSTSSCLLLLPYLSLSMYTSPHSHSFYLCSTHLLLQDISFLIFVCLFPGLSRYSELKNQFTAAFFLPIWFHSEYYAGSLNFFLGLFHCVLQL